MVQPRFNPLASAIAYAPFGNLQHYTDGSGQIHRRTHDLNGRPTGYTLGTATWQVSYDSANRIIGQMDASNAARSVTYGYDNLDRLTGASLPNASYGYGYDANGNRTTHITGGTTRAYGIAPNSNWLNSLTNPSQTVTHDTSGNRTSDATATYAYDARGRLIKAVSAAGTTTYQVNALGQRIRKTLVQGTTPVSDTVFHYDSTGRLIGESNAAGQVQREYVWLEETPVAVVDTLPGQTTKIGYLHTDHLNTPRLVTDDQGKIIWRNSPLTEPFGNSPPEEDPDGDGVLFTLNLRFPGQYFDKETNLSYNAQRDGYDSMTGRFTQPDPVGLAGGSWSLYTYTNQNPLSYTDPTGEFALPALIPLVGLITGAVIGNSIQNSNGSGSGKRDDGSMGGAFPPGTFPGNSSNNGGPMSRPDPVESRYNNDPYKLPIVNPGRDCNGNCNPCPPGKTWRINKPGHGWQNWYEHRIEYNQNKATCECFPDRPSSGLLTRPFNSSL